jgi:hypothetical protein
MKFYKPLIALLFIVQFTACRKEEAPQIEDSILGLGGDTWQQTAIDKWIYDTLTVPYNIAVKYKWDQFELALDKTLVPQRKKKLSRF